MPRACNDLQTLFSRHRLLICLSLSLLLMFGCTTTNTAPLQFSGFLEDYAGLRPSADEPGAWTYRTPGVSLRGYSKVMIDPLVIWPHPNLEYQGINSLMIWQLALTFDDRMRKALVGGYPVVTEEGPGVLRLRTALTDVALKRAGLSLSDPFLPLVQDVLLQASEKVSGLNAVDGRVSVEAELLDSQTHERLAMYVEQRKSEHVLLTNKNDSLSPIIEIFDYWAKKFRQRLDEEHGVITKTETSTP